MLLIPTLLCPKPWEGMSGDETRRFCSYCRKHVHNLEAMSVSERLALLSSPAASICSRYQVAIRRPVKGKEESYARHLLKCGAGVALTGSVLLVLWEMYQQTEKEKWLAEHQRNYRVGLSDGIAVEMPKELYCEHRMVAVGMIELPSLPGIEPGEKASVLPGQIDVRLDPVEVDRLIEQSKPGPPKPGQY